jgi:hypothetical protein
VSPLTLSLSPAGRGEGEGCVKTPKNEFAKESSEEPSFALLITQILKNDSIDFSLFSMDS